MIFTRHFGALRAFPTDFASTIVNDAEAPEARTQTEPHGSVLFRTEEKSHGGRGEHAA